MTASTPSRDEQRQLGRAAHLAVFGVPRTGTTLLANLLTVPEERRWCAVEPGSFGGAKQARIFNRAKRLGWTLPGNSTEDVREFLSTLDRFGVKEVHEGQTGGALKAFRFQRIVACVRDARDIAVSLMDPRFVHQRRPVTAQGMARLTGRYLAHFLKWRKEHDVIVVRYEDLVRSESYRDVLGETLDWPLEGDPNRNLGLYRRGDEKRAGVFSRRTPADREQHRSFLDEVHSVCADYQEHFGYT